MTTATKPTTRVTYDLKLHSAEACNCDVACGCQFGIGPLKGKCEFIVGYQVIDGKVGTVDMTGVTFAIACAYPGAIHEGCGRVALFVDEKATQAQTDALVSVLSGQLGGMPWEAIAGTVEKFIGPVRKPIEATVAGTRSRFRIPGVLELQQQPVKDPVTGEEKDMHIVYPKGGFFWDDGSVCTTGLMQADYEGIRFDHKGQYSAYAVARWTNGKS